MPLTVFDNAYFLASLGWAVANSLWQAGALWLLYKSVTVTNRNLSALFKYHLSILFLFSSFAWFVITVIQNYLLLKNSPLAAISLYGTGKLIFLQKINVVLPYLAVIYLSLLVLFTVKFIRHYADLRFIKTKGLLKAPVDIRVFTGSIALQLGIKKKVQVWLSDNVDVPSVIGFIKPVILLPVAVISQLSSSQAETILLHELAHIKRNDFLVNLIQSIAGLLLFFNPFVKLLGKEIRKEREDCCDDWVLNYQYNKHEYASALLVLEKQRHQQLAFVLAATNGKKVLLKRIERLFKALPQTDFNFAQKLQLAVAGIATAIFMLAALPWLASENKVQTTKAEMPVAARFAAVNSIVSNNIVSKENMPAKIFVNNKLLKIPAVKKAAAPVKPAVIKAAQNTAGLDYSLALVNEELLKTNKELASAAIAIADKEGIFTKEIFVKIEEEQSGKKQKNIYYLQLDNKNGQTKIKPLLILNKYNNILKKTAAKKSKLNAVKKVRNKGVTS